MLEQATVRQGAELVHNCADYLKQQITQYMPRLIICNGSPVSRYIQDEFPRNDDSTNTQTSYWATVEDIDMCVILTGFIGRIDNYSRRRLGVEIETRLKESEQRFATMG